MTTHALTPLDRPAGPDTVGEIEPLVGFVAVAGPPAILIVAPLVLLALAVAGPFTVLLTTAAAIAAAVGVVALAGAILASPYLLVRHLRARRAARAAKPAGTRARRLGALSRVTPRPSTARGARPPRSTRRSRARG